MPTTSLLHHNHESKLNILCSAMTACLNELEVLRLLDPQAGEVGLLRCNDDGARLLAAASWLGDQKLIETLLSSSGSGPHQ